MAKEATAGSIGHLLLQNKLVSSEELAEANQRRRAEEKPLGRVLVEMGALDEEKKLALYHQLFGHEIVSLEDFDIDPHVLAILPRSFCERHVLAPILRERNAIVLAVEDPSNVLALDEARDLSGMEIQPVLASCRDILQALQQYPQKDDEGRVIGAEPEPPSRLQQFVHLGIVFLIAILPIVIPFIAFWQEPNLGYAFTAFFRNDRFEMVLFPFLCWALWLVTIYEVHGLIFRPSHGRR
ncbi:MAG: hypothetical protein NTW86_03755 [Candidatus Sumerlaeota bacterium]|nr:hypothetical protein [Candidatus Sumerlaeota bacterium]